MEVLVDVTLVLNPFYPWFQNASRPLYWPMAVACSTVQGRSISAHHSGSECVQSAFIEEFSNPELEPSAQEDLSGAELVQGAVMEDTIGLECFPSSSSAVVTAIPETCESLSNSSSSDSGSSSISESDVSPIDSDMSSSDLSPSDLLSSHSSSLSSRYSTESSDSDSDSEDNVQQVKKLFENSELSVDEGVLALMNLYKKRKVEKGAMGDILKVVLLFLPKVNNMPKSQHLLFKYVKDLSPISPYQVHYYCRNCLYYVGRVNSQCPLCESRCNKFLQLSLADQIKCLFELHDLADMMDQYDAERKKDGCVERYADICDGSEFKRAWCGGI